MNHKTQRKFNTINKHSKLKHKKPIKCIAHLIGDKVSGNVIFTEIPHLNTVKINVNLTGLKPGLHGFHIHEAGNIENHCNGCCAHFNPFNTTHGGPNDKIRHVGDLGNVTADHNGNVSHLFYDKIIKLRGNKTNIIGRSVVVHTDIDDLGKGGNKESLITGNAGSREACGVIGYMEPFYF
jgi:Cu-Zn family superoxide dismutase